MISDPLCAPPEMLFDCIMGINRTHRQWLNNAIKKTPSINDCTLLNFFGAGDPYLPATDFSWDQPAPGTTVHGSSVHLYEQVRFPLACVLPVAIFKKTWFSLTTESRENHLRYFSEKTAKPLLGRRLFILFAAPGMLADLKTLGFQTFDSIVDESYDGILDDETRWQRAFDQAIWLSQQDPVKIYKKIKPVLDHNHEHFLSINWESKMIGEMQDIINFDK